MRTILIVKRQPNLRTHLSTSLYALFHPARDTRFVQCGTFTNALGRLRERGLAGIVTGTHLNDGSGEELYSAVRKREGMAEIPIVFFTRDPNTGNMVNTLSRSGDRNVRFVNALHGSEVDIARALRAMFKTPALA